MSNLDIFIHEVGKCDCLQCQSNLHEGDTGQGATVLGGHQCF